MTVMNLFSHFYEQLKVDDFCNFCPQIDLLPEKTGNTVKRGPDSSLVFISLKSCQQAYSNNNTNLKGKRSVFFPVSFQVIHLVCMFLVCKLPQNDISNL